MLTTVMAGNLLLFFIGWELMGLCSYLLIGFWYFRPSAAEAAKKAFITTRIGDVGLLLGIVWLYNQAGSLTFGTGAGELFNPAFLERIRTAQTALGMSVATGIVLLLFMGTIGKSAQFPLHVWLPDAMEGPTPVSALIHAATMVAAGVFLVARTYPIFQVSGALPFVAAVGAFTALFAALIAVGQYDIKRILAYSTISQLGFMIAALGLGAWLAALFHLLTNAFFKALLFLGSGSVIHGMEGVVGHDPARAQDIRRMGGLRRHMSWTFWTYMAAYLALAGIFPFAGFWSKDEILLEAWQNNLAVYIVLAIASFLTAFYMTRQVALVFFGAFRGRQQAETAGGHATHSTPHESPPVLVVPLIVLALFAVGGGLANAGLLGIRWLADFTGAESPQPELTVPLITSAVSLLGIALGWLLYRNAYQSARDPDPLVRTLGPLYRALERKFYLDDLYGATIIRLNAWLGGAARWLDDNVVDRVVNLVGPATVFLGYVNFIIDDVMLNDGADMLAKETNKAGDEARRTQSGHVQDYLALIFVGVLVMGIIFIYVL
jgi:NADH-quinone oxidoreductase subunit L